MPEKKRNPAYVLSLLLAVFMAVQSSGGLVIGGLYRDNAWVASAWRANDFVTLFAAVPVLLVALAFARRGSARARLVLMGVLYYGFYNNMYYLFGAAFNQLFLVYTGLAILSSFALVFELSSIDIDGIRPAFPVRIPQKTIAAWMFLFSGTLGVMWIGQCLQYVFTGKVPQLLTDTGGLTHLVAALDLWLVASPCFLSAAWLWKGRPWGYLLSSGLLVQGTLTSLVLIVSAPFQDAAGIQGAWNLMPLWSVLGAGCLGASCILVAEVVTDGTKWKSCYALTGIFHR